MAIVNPPPPPDGFYWFTPADPKKGEVVVRVRRYHGNLGMVDVEFCGTDETPSWGDKELDGMFTPVAPRSI